MRARILSIGSLIAFALAGYGLAGRGARGQTAVVEPATENTQVRDARSGYEAELRAALEPIEKRYVAKLKELREQATRSGNAAAALAITTELDYLSRDRAPVPASSLEGKWVVRYANGTARTYRLRSDGILLFEEGNRLGRLAQHGPDLLVDTGDGNVERLRVKQVLQVEHFNPVQSYVAGGQPATIGKGERTKSGTR